MTTAELLSNPLSGGLILGLLLILSVWMWTLILLKGTQFWWLSRQERPLKDCQTAFAADQTVSGWQGVLLRQFQRLAPVSRQQPQVWIELGEQLAGQLERPIPTILVLAQTAPLLGLLGTVMGMVVTFDVLHTLGGSDLKRLSEGISQALVTTQAGLLVAIPGLVVGSLLRRHAEKLRDRIEAFAIAVGRHRQSEDG